MKPFSMESVLRYRIQLEKLAQQKLFSILKQKIKIKQQAKQLENELGRLYEGLASEQQHGLTVEKLIITENWISARQKSLEKVRGQLDLLSEQALQSRKKLIEAGRDKKALEKLKKKQNAAFKHYLEKKEMASFDEIAVLRHNH